MDFTFTEEQLLFQNSARALFQRECTGEILRNLAQTGTGRSGELWKKLAEVGVLGIQVPEAFGGMGMNEIDFILIAEECGRSALPAPVMETAAIGVPLLNAVEVPSLKQEWLPNVVEGKAVFAVSHPLNVCVVDAHVADLLFLFQDAELHAVPRNQVEIHPQLCLDPSRRLFQIQWTPSPKTRIASGGEASRLMEEVLNWGALTCAAQQIGIGQQLVDMAVDYAKKRHQFGKPIGSFQAIKHHLATVQVKLEFAKPVVYRAAYSMAHRLPRRGLDISHAKVAASEAAVLAAKTALQCHGAIGYTGELDLHFWMKRAWALEAEWGTTAWHKARVGNSLFQPDMALGPSATFMNRL